MWFVEKAREIARQCVEPPRKPKPNAQPFVKKTSLEPVVSFLVKHVKRYPQEICQICRNKAFPEVRIKDLVYRCGIGTSWEFRPQRNLPNVYDESKYFIAFNHSGSQQGCAQ